MHISLDLETLGNEHDAAITQIGWAIFDIESGEVLSKIGTLVKDGLDFGKPNASTLAWWLKQDAPAQKRMALALDGGATLGWALCQLRDDIDAFGAQFVWGNGATFDVTILECAHRKAGFDIPWKFWNVRDMRTIVSLAEQLRAFDKKSVAFDGVPHVAADDAAHQARVISAAFNSLR